jgi:HAAS domain-containing protein
MSSTPDQLIERYMKHLRVELEDLPRARRRELEQEIAEHIAEARAELPSESEAEIRNLLDRVGDPAEIAAEARERFGVQPRRSGTLERITLVLLLIGGIVIPVIGWLVGVVLLWSSEVWTAREKLIGTLVVPGGLALPLFIELAATSSELCVSYNGGPATCEGGPSTLHQVLVIALMAALVIGPLFTTVYLSRRLRRPSLPVAV